MTTKTIWLSVDVEEDLPGILPPSTHGVEIGLPNLLQVLEETHLQADFFFLASIVRTNPGLVRQIAKLGHGIGNHGLDHQFLCGKPFADQQREVQTSTQILERIVSPELRMFRAAGFSANQATLRILEGEGYLVDSSILPGRIKRRFRLFPVYDHRGARKEPHFPVTSEEAVERRLLEVPVTENPLLPGAPLGLGAVNAFGPAAILDALRATDLRTIVFLVHPWELVDLKAFCPKLPASYARACSPDIRKIRDFLRAARDFATFVTLAGARQRYLGA